jgi:hypothetical protein
MFDRAEQGSPSLVLRDLQVGQRLADADQRLERVADVGEAVEHVVDRPAVGAEFGVVELGPLERHRHGRPSGTDTGAPAAGRTLYGATSVLLTAFCV